MEKSSLEQDADIVFAAGHSLNSYGLQDPPFRDLAVLSDLHCSQFRQTDPAALQADVVIDVHCGVGLLTALSAFEARIAASILFEKVAVGGIQMAQALLQGDAVHFLLQYICG